MLIGVLDQTMPVEEQEHFLEILRSSLGELGDQKRVIYSWAYWQELGGFDSSSIRKDQVPFVMIKEADENWLPFYYINPGSSCYNSVRNSTVKVESPDQVTSFIRRYLTN